VAMAMLNFWATLKRFKLFLQHHDDN